MDDAPRQTGDKLASALNQDRGKLLGHARRLLGGRLQDQDPEDVLSDVVLRLLERADLLAEIENVTAYLVTALGNRVADLFRRKREQPIPEGLPEPLAPEDPEARRDVGRALSLLDTAERAVWLAVEMDGRSFRELAEAWGEPIGTLLSRKNRAGKKMRKTLE